MRIVLGKIEAVPAAGGLMAIKVNKLHGLNRFTILISRADDRQIVRNGRELVAKRHLVPLREMQRRAAQGGEPKNHVVGALRIRMHLLGDGVQRVEEKVRAELRLEHA